MADRDSRSERIGVTVLGSGSGGNATVIHTDDAAILIDAGFSAKELRRRMLGAGVDPARLRAVLISHEHGDHVKGLPVLVRQLGLPIYTNRETAAVLRRRTDDIGTVHLFSSGTSFVVGGFAIEPFSIPHDANDPVGFIVGRGGLRIGVATDLGHVNSMVSHHLRGCDVLIVESNHSIGMVRASSRPWSLKQRVLGRHGHLSNEDSIAMLRAVVHERTRHLVLAHISAECNEAGLVAAGVAALLRDLGRVDIQAHVARQDDWLPTIWVG